MGEGSKGPGEKRSQKYGESGGEDKADDDVPDHFDPQLFFSGQKVGRRDIYDDLPDCFAFFLHYGSEASYRYVPVLSLNDRHARFLCDPILQPVSLLP